MSNVIVILKGGLGNQLFQYGAALRLVRGDISKILFCKDQLSDRMYRLPELFPSSALPVSLQKDELAERLSSCKAYMIEDVHQNPYRNQVLLDASDELLKNIIVLNGYFQSGHNLCWLVNLIDVLGGVNACPMAPHYDQIESERLVVHMRMGDYFRQDVQRQIGLINFGYFDKVIGEALNSGREVVIYSDDPRKVRQFFAHPGIEIPDALDDIEIFRRFLGARVLVTSNSTFSLTAAYISEILLRLVRPARWAKVIVSDELLWGFRREVDSIPTRFY